jgi:transcription elongation GreA/GreB family factor
MSRAFVRESDRDDAALPERVISPHANFVTPTGLQQIVAQLQALEAERSAARAADDKSALARIERDLRYWQQRRASARLVEVTSNPDAIRFGVRATVRFEDGSERSFRLVGEDEADPARGLVSWVSPIAQKLIGLAVGDDVEIFGRSAHITRIEA